MANPPTLNSSSSSLPSSPTASSGFTLIELVAVIVIIGVVITAAAPRFLDVGTDARRAALRNISAQAESAAKLVQLKAQAKGLQASATRVTNSEQGPFVVDFAFGRTEVEWKNLCPESRAELDDAMGLLDFIDLDTDTHGLETRVTNRYVFVGYTIAADRLADDAQGCYFIYDSFAVPNCTFRVVDNSC